MTDTSNNWRVGEFWSSANPGKKCLLLAQGLDIGMFALHKTFIQWVDRAEPEDMLNALRGADRLLRAAGFAMTGTCSSKIVAAIAAHAGSAAPVDMILHCPQCHTQHVDAVTDKWDNPPHRSHLCHACGHIWRPADVPTNGVQAIATRGKDDSPTEQARKSKYSFALASQTIGQQDGSVETHHYDSPHCRNCDDKGFPDGDCGYCGK